MDEKKISSYCARIKKGETVELLNEEGYQPEVVAALVRYYGSCVSADDSEGLLKLKVELRGDDFICAEVPEDLEPLVKGVLHASRMAHESWVGVQSKSSPHVRSLGRDEIVCLLWIKDNWPVSKERFPDLIEKLENENPPLIAYFEPKSENSRYEPGYLLTGLGHNAISGYHKALFY